MQYLPKQPHLFLYWWAISAPMHLFNVVKRVIILTNSTISFTLNLRLLFTPLFGDYTIIGRFIGFVVRIFEIIFGLFFMLVLSVVSLILPVLWWLLPFYLFLEIKILLLPVILGIYIIWGYLTKSTPEKKVAQVDENDCTKAFRPQTFNLLTLIQKDHKTGIEHLLKDKQIISFLRKTELQNNEFTQKLSQAPVFDKQNLCKVCLEYAKLHKSRYIETEQLFTTVLKSIPKIDNVLSTYESKLEVIENSAKWVVNERENLAKLFIWQPDYETLFTGGFGKGMTGRVTPFLDSMSTDFTRQAKRGGFERFAVRDDEIAKVAELLGGSNINLLVIGEPGSGKTSLVRGLAYNIILGNKYKSLANKRIVSLELSGIVAGTKTVGEVAERINNAMAEAKGSRDIILFIDEIHTLVAGAGEKDGAVSSIYSILEPQLSSGDIQFIGATNIENYRKYIEPNGAFARLFKIFEIEESDKEETINVLKFDVRDLERKKGLFVTYPALEKIVDLSKKLIHERVLPDKAIIILDRTASSVEGNTKVVDTKAVIKEISEMTKIPAEMVSEDEAQKLLRIEEELQKMVIGQDHAIKQVSAALKRARAGIRDEGKPIASFLFVGTTGVGKTQTAKALAKSYFGNIKNMIRLDMSEYQQIDSMSRLIGSPDGSTKGILTEAVRTRPFGLILLDEIEKAHPNILLTFLQVFDDGRLTDASGRTVDFTNTIIISTSNVGTREIQEVFKSNGNFEKMEEVAMIKVREHFAPEFLNRFTGVIVFNPLSQDVLRKITYLLLDNVIKSAQEKHIKISFTEDVINELMKRGYSPEWGARPMARAIEDTVELYIATKLLSKALKPGDEVELGMEVFEDN